MRLTIFKRTVPLGSTDAQSAAALPELLAMGQMIVEVFSPRHSIMSSSTLTLPVRVVEHRIDDLRGDELAAGQRAVDGFPHASPAALQHG